MKRKQSPRFNEVLSEIDALIEDFEKQRQKSGDLLKEIEGYGGASPGRVSAPQWGAMVDAGRRTVDSARGKAAPAIEGLKKRVSSAKVPLKTISRSVDSAKKSLSVVHGKARALAAQGANAVRPRAIDVGALKSAARVPFERVRIVRSAESLAPPSRVFRMPSVSIPVLNKIQWGTVFNELRGMTVYKMERARSSVGFDPRRLALPLAVVFLALSAVFFMVSAIGPGIGGFTVAPLRSSIQEVVVGPAAGEDVWHQWSACAGVACTQPPNAQCFSSPGVCTQGTCSYDQFPQGTSCDDGRGCTTFDSCDVSGTCSGTVYCPDACRGDIWLTAGTCQDDGECAYLEIACEHGCRDGACVVPGQDDSQSTSGGYVGEYYDNVNLTGHPVVTRLDPVVNFQWLETEPAPEVGIDQFSVRWSRNITFEQGRYRFTARADDGVRVFIDGNAVYELHQWGTEPGIDLTAERDMAAGPHEVIIEYFEDVDDASVFFDYVEIVSS